MEERRFRLVQVFNGDAPVLAEPIVAVVDEESGMAQTLTFRVVCGSFDDYVWSLDIEVGEWNGIPRIVAVESSPRLDDLGMVS